MCTLREPTVSDKRYWSDKIMNKSTMHVTVNIHLVANTLVELGFSLRTACQPQSTHSAQCSLHCLTVGLDAVRSRKLRLPQVRARVLDHADVCPDVVRCARTVPSFRGGGGGPRLHIPTVTDMTVLESPAVQNLALKDGSFRK